MFQLFPSLQDSMFFQKRPIISGNIIILIAAKVVWGGIEVIRNMWMQISNLHNNHYFSLFEDEFQSS